MRPAPAYLYGRGRVCQDAPTIEFRMLTLLAFVKSPLGKWLCIGLALAAILGGLYLKGVRVGVAKGEQKVSQQVTDATEQSRAVAKETTKQEIAQANQQISAAQADFSGHLRQDAAMASALTQTNAQLEALRAEVKSLKDGDLHAYNVQKIGLRKDGEANSCYTGAEERAISDAVVAAPLLNQKVSQIEADMQEVRGQVGAAKAEIAGLNQKVTALATYTNELEKDYTTLYNLNPPKRRSPKCLWLWKCGKKRLPVPDPKELLAARPK